MDSCFVSQTAAPHSIQGQDPKFPKQDTRPGQVVIRYAQVIVQVFLWVFVWCFLSDVVLKISLNGFKSRQLEITRIYTRVIRPQLKLSLGKLDIVSWIEQVSAVGEPNYIICWHQSPSILIFLWLHHIQVSLQTRGHHLWLSLKGSMLTTRI